MSSSASTPMCTPTPPPCVDAAHRRGPGEITVEATADGYAELVAFADQHSGLRAWAIEGTGGHGAGLTRHLAGAARAGGRAGPARTRPRRNGAKSDPLDAIRAAREALSRPGSVRPAAGGRPPGAVGAAGGSPLRGRGRHRRPTQLFSLVIAAPEAGPGPVPRPEAARDAAHRRRACASHPSWDTETTITVTVLRSLARRARSCRRRPPSTRRPSWPSCGPGARTCSTSPASARSSPRPCSAPGPTPAGSTPTPPSPCSPAPPHPGHQRPGHHPAPAQPLRRPPAQPRPAHHRPVPHPLRPRTRPTPPDAPPKARPTARSNAASSATSPETSTGSSNTHPQPLDDP